VLFRSQPDETPALDNDVERGPPCVLVVEDEALISLMTEGYLVDLGYRAVLACNSAEAIAFLARGVEPSLAVINLKLPAGSGGEVVRALWARWPATPVIVASGYATLPGHLEAPVAAGLLVHLEKPWQPEVFVETVRRLARPAGARGRG
jgi:CheY-like chemotaxis protein